LVKYLIFSFTIIFLLYYNPKIASGLKKGSALLMGYTWLFKCFWKYAWQ